MTEPREATAIVTIPERPIDGTRRVLVKVGEEESFIESPAFVAMGQRLSVVPHEGGWALAEGAG